MTKRPSITLSPALAEAADLLRKRRHYRTLSEYVQGLIRYDGQTQRDHLLTAEWASMSPAERDLLDGAILRQVQSEKGVRGSWIEACIEEIVAKHIKATGKAPTAKEVAKELGRALSD